MTLNPCFEGNPSHLIMIRIQTQLYRWITGHRGIAKGPQVEPFMPSAEAAASFHDAVISPPSPGSSEGTHWHQLTKAPILGTAAITPYRLFNVLATFIFLTVKLAESLKGENFKLTVLDYLLGIVSLFMYVFLFTYISLQISNNKSSS